MTAPDVSTTKSTATSATITTTSTSNKRHRMLNPQSVFERIELERWLQDDMGIRNAKSYRHRIWRNLTTSKTGTTVINNDSNHDNNHDSKGSAIRSVPELRRCVYDDFDTKFAVCTSTVIETKISDANDGCKLVIQLQDGHKIETVIIHHHRRPKHNHNHSSNNTNTNIRSTVCVSSQVGCQMGCTFCATGTMGFIANLTSGEILEQIYYATKLANQQKNTISNVVFMGMGEPLDNYGNVLQAIQDIPLAFPNIPLKRITLSTVGIPKMIVRLHQDCPDVQLALSLHAPNDTIRKQIVPTAKAHSLRKIMDAIFIYQYGTTITTDSRNGSINGKEKSDCNGSIGKCIMIEYIMIDQINSSRECAIELRSLLSGMNCIVNLIPYNPTVAGDRYTYNCPSDADMNQFQQILLSSDGQPQISTSASSEEGEGKEGEGEKGNDKVSSLPDQNDANNNNYKRTNNFDKNRLLKCTIRWSSRRGQNIDAACGQLVLQSNTNDMKDTKKCNNDNNTAADIEDLVPKRLISSNSNNHSNGKMTSTMVGTNKVVPTGKSHADDGTEVKEDSSSLQSLSSWLSSSVASAMANVTHNTTSYWMTAGGAGIVILLAAGIVVVASNSQQQQRQR